MKGKRMIYSQGELKIFSSTYPAYYSSEEFQTLIFKQITPRVRGKVNYRLYRLTSIMDHPDIDDFLSEALMKTCNTISKDRLAQCAGAEERLSWFLNYFQKTVKNTITSYFRRPDRRQHYKQGDFDNDMRDYCQDESSSDPFSVEIKTPKSEEPELDAKYRIRQIFSMLPEADFEILWLRAVEGREVREIEERLEGKLSSNAIRVKYSRTLRKVREHFSKPDDLRALFGREDA